MSFYTICFFFSVKLAHFFQHSVLFSLNKRWKTVKLCFYQRCWSDIAMIILSHTTMQSLPPCDCDCSASSSAATATALVLYLWYSTWIICQWHWVEQVHLERFCQTFALVLPGAKHSALAAAVAAFEHKPSLQATKSLSHCVCCSLFHGLSLLFSRM